MKTYSNLSPLPSPDNDPAPPGSLAANALALAAQLNNALIPEIRHAKRVLKDLSEDMGQAGSLRRIAADLRRALRVNS